VALASDPTIGLVVKHLPQSKEMAVRTKHLADLALPCLSPYLAAPIAFHLPDRGDVLHLAPLAIGQDLLTDARTYPEHMEIAYHLSCLLTILEENGLAHGDIGPSNMMITPNGEVYLIDFDNFSSLDPSVPPPNMAGQREMMAPELRAERGQTADMMSDRFAYGVIYNILLMRRHPVANAQVPAEMDKALTSGIWLERHLPRGPDDIPVEVLGNILPALFDRAFSLIPSERPSADEWRRALSGALQNMVIHDCGGAFVLGANQARCPYCSASILSDRMKQINMLKISIPSVSARFGLDLQNGKPIILGRGNFGGETALVSGHHLEITPIGRRIFLRHLGRNPTHIFKDGQWYNLSETWIELDDITQASIPMKLADLQIDIGV